MNIMTNSSFSKTQAKKGIVIIVVFILLRALITKIWEDYFGLNYECSLSFCFFLFSIFLVTSIGLVYIGFTKWVRIDLKKLWYDRKRFLGDIGWGIIGFLITFISLLAIAIVVSTLGLIPSGITTAQLSPIQYLLSLFFGFAIAAFQEETIFRGFLQNIFMEKLGNWHGNILQAAIFSISHIGYYSLSSWYLFIITFINGIIFGWLKMKRGTLIASAIAHGLTG